MSDHGLWKACQHHYISSIGLFQLELTQTSLFDDLVDFSKFNQLLVLVVDFHFFAYFDLS